MPREEGEGLAVVLTPPPNNSLRLHPVTHRSQNQAGESSSPHRLNPRSRKRENRQVEERGERERVWEGVGEEVEGEEEETGEVIEEVEEEEEEGEGGRVQERQAALRSGPMPCQR